MKTLKKLLAWIFLGVLAIIILVPVTAYAATLDYVGKVCFSAYYPDEVSEYPNNFKGQPLKDMVGDIVACPTGSPLLGKTIQIVTNTGEVLIRKVWDTGCKKGRMDMLTANHKEMNLWGLRNCDVWVVQDEKLIQSPGTDD